MRAIAKAPLIDVLRVWSGLGYNRRAKYLHDAAKNIIQKHGGKVPRDYITLRALPGVGDYTAKAVRAFTFNEQEDLIDTNVRSAIIHHFLPTPQNTITPCGRTCLSYVGDEEVRAIAERAAKGQNPREWHSALMDYGSHLKKSHPTLSRGSTRHVKQSKFQGLLRQVRGAILRATINNNSLQTVRRASDDQYDAALFSLIRDGLLEKKP